MHTFLISSAVIKHDPPPSPKQTKPNYYVLRDLEKIDLDHPPPSPIVHGA